MENNKLRIEDFIMIETHFGVSEHFIRADTRNKCSENFVAMLEEIGGILYPDEGLEIYFLPAESGSYTDKIKLFFRKNKGLGVIAVGTLALGFLNYSDSHEVHLNDKKMWVVDEVSRCLDFQKKIEDLKNEGYDIGNIPQGKLSEVCGSVNLIKRKNNFYNTIQNDGMVKSTETFLKDGNDISIFSKKIERVDFPKYIEAIPDQKFSQENLEGVIEVISPVFKQKKEGKGLAWRGQYYGAAIFYKDVAILQEGDDIDFYMQDSDFKNQISSSERTFAAKDNMRIIFDITGELKGGEFLNRSIYIKEVKSYNEDIIPHKLKNSRNVENISSEGQVSLFGNL